MRSSFLLRQAKSYSHASKNQLKDLKQQLNSSSSSLILLEGHRMLIDTLQYQLDHRHPPHSLPSTTTIGLQSIYLTDDGIKSSLGQKLLSLLENYSSSGRSPAVYHLDSKLLSLLSTVQTSQGIIGIYNKPRYNLEDLQINLSKLSSPFLIVCDRIRDPGNLGSIIRSAYSLGADSIISIESCDPWSPKVLRSSMAYGLRFPILSWKWSEIEKLSLFSELLRSQPYQILITDCDSSACYNSEMELMNYYQIDFRRPTLLLIGSEAIGVSEEAKCYQWPYKPKYIHIPMTRTDSESLNAAAACSIILGEVQRQRYRC